VVVRELAEELFPRLRDVVGVLDQGIGVDIRLSDLAIGSVVAQEPVVANGLRVRSLVSLIISAAWCMKPSNSPSRTFSRAVTSNMLMCLPLRARSAHRVYESKLGDSPASRLLKID
jgi:hypothetical protein